MYHPKIDKKLPKYLNFEDLERLLNSYNKNTSIDVRNSLILEILYSTGIRVSELANLKINNINIGEKKIKILGKGSKERIVYFGKRCEILLNKYLNEYYKTLNIDNLDYLIISKRGKKINIMMKQS